MNIEAMKKKFQEQGISFTETRRSWYFDCPKCGREDKAWLIKESGYTSCWSCGESWKSWKQVLRAIFGQDSESKFASVFEVQTGEFVQGLSCDLIWGSDEEEILEAADAPLTPISLPMDFVPVENSEAGLAYCIERGITDPSVIARFDIRYSAFMNAVIFPVFMDGKYYGWQARRIPPVEKGAPRLITSPGFKKAEFLLNYAGLHKSQKTQLQTMLHGVILCEGPVDCAHADVVEGFRAVASFGKLVSKQQLQLLANCSVDSIYLGLDRDAARELDNLVSALSPSKRLFRLMPPEHRSDLGECTPDEIREAIKGAQQLSPSRAARLEVYLKL